MLRGAVKKKGGGRRQDGKNRTAVHSQNTVYHMSKMFCDHRPVAKVTSGAMSQDAVHMEGHGMPGTPYMWQQKVYTRIAIRHVTCLHVLTCSWPTFHVAFSISTAMSTLNQ